MNGAEESQRKKRHERSGAGGTLLHMGGSVLSHVKDFGMGGRALGPISVRSAVVRAHLRQWDWLCVVVSFCDNLVRDQSGC